MSDGNYFCDGKSQWLAPTLWKAAAEGPSKEFELSLQELLAEVEFDDFAPLATFKDTVDYFQRVMNANLSYPIVVYQEDSKSIILDGFHRTMKAIITSQSLIKAIRLYELPKPDRSADGCQVSGCGNPRRCPGCRFTCHNDR